MATREEVLDRLHRNQETLLRELQDVPEAAMTEPFAGTWSSREILVHLGAWYDMMGLAMERMARGERPAPEGVDLGDADAMNARYVEQAQGKSVAAVRKDVETGLARFEAGVKALPEDRFAEGKTAMRILETMAGHPDEHLEDIRAWKQSRKSG